jgi:hypothetical protein
MAGDLIPPPSPAGRPDGRSGDGADRPAEGHKWLTEETPSERVEETAALEDSPPPAASKPPPSRYRSRFGFVLGALGGTAVVAVLLAVVVIAGVGGDSVPSGWSSWHPTAGDDYAAADQIAEHVESQYRSADGNQLVLIEAGPPEIASNPLSIALRTAPTGGDIELIEGKGVMYTLNGLGDHGSVKGGTPSAARLALLKREALELALYTFRYVDDIDSVVALLPPPKQRREQTPLTQPSVEALFFRPGDLKRQLDRPLRVTFSGPTPRPETLDPGEAGAITRLTRPNTFAASFIQGQNAHLFLVLDRPMG